MQSLLLKIKNAPRKPGVYIFKQAEDIIYVGKAKDINKRVASYFTKKHSEAKTASLVKKINDVDFTVTRNEVEALILENTLIKKHKPTYNISFRDDKSYPFLAVTLDDTYPRITITRESHKRKTKYFGPYTNVRALRQTLDTLRRIFPLRTCRSEEPGRKGKSPCLNYHIKRCPGPCTGGVSEKEYGKVVKQAIEFLEGRGERVLKSLENQMKHEAGKLNFEEATRLRNRLESAQQVLSKQQVVSEVQENVDILGICQSEAYVNITLFAIRNGKLVATENFDLDRGLEKDPISSFIKQYYTEGSFVPDSILVCLEPEEKTALEKWLATNLGKRVKIHLPQRGRKKRLVDMASENAGYSLQLNLKRLEVEAKNALAASKGLELLMGIENIGRIECYDVSNISGSNATASMVVFKSGLPSKKDYRKFRIRTADGVDDYAMIYEALSRRLKKLGQPPNHPTTKPLDTSFRQKPDLIVVDGGAGHLSTAVKAIRDSGVLAKVISIAKKNEELFLPGKRHNVKLSEDDPVLHLMQRLRDEAHRFALEYHRKLRSKDVTESALDQINGIGDVKKKALIERFGSARYLRRASLEQIMQVPGINEKLAKTIHETFKEVVS